VTRLRVLNPTLLNWLLWVPGCILFASAVSQLASPRGWRRHVAVVVAALALLLPWLAPSGSVLRAFVALYLLWTYTKVFDMTRDREVRSPLFRWIWMLVIHDLRRDGYSRAGARPELRLGLFLSACAGLAAAFACLHVALFEADAFVPPVRWLVRYGAGLLLCYFGVEGALRSFEFFDRLFGLDPPVLHKHPILALSLAEFWGRRWNRVVGHWLFTALYRPVALRGQPLLAVLAAFAGSALLHLYFTWAAIGVSWGLMMASFFLLQVPLLLLEIALAQQRWPRPLRRVWTLGCLVLTSPLFVAPTLVTLGNGFACNEPMSALSVKGSAPPAEPSEARRRASASAHAASGNSS
jgi:Membrane bound O-acyl transferase family